MKFTYYVGRLSLWIPWNSRAHVPIHKQVLLSGVVLRHLRTHNNWSISWNSARTLNDLSAAKMKDGNRRRASGTRDGKEWMKSHMRYSPITPSANKFRLHSRAYTLAPTELNPLRSGGWQWFNVNHLRTIGDVPLVAWRWSETTETSAEFNGKTMLAVRLIRSLSSHRSQTSAYPLCDHHLHTFQPKLT